MYADRISKARTANAQNVPEMETVMEMENVIVVHVDVSQIMRVRTVGANPVLKSATIMVSVNAVCFIFNVTLYKS